MSSSWRRQLLVFACLFVLPTLSLGEAAEPAPSVPSATAPAAPSTSPPTGDELRQAVRMALRSSALRGGTVASDQSVTRLVSLYKQVQQDTELPAAERERLRLALRGSLSRISQALQRRHPDILAQQFPLGGQPAAQGAAAAQPVDHGQELVELIESTIFPMKWDTNGGQGTIRYWPMGHALVVRQTGDVHEDLGRLLEDLR
jgi:hypothetical protein